MRQSWKRIGYLHKDKRFGLSTSGRVKVRDTGKETRGGGGRREKERERERARVEESNLRRLVGNPIYI